MSTEPVAITSDNSGLRDAASDGGDLRQMAAILNGLRALGYSSSDIPTLVAGTLPQHRVTKLSPRSVTRHGRSRQKPWIAFPVGSNATCPTSASTWRRRSGEGC